MLLAVDIGNTNIVLGVWNGSGWQAHWRLRTVRERTADEFGIYLKGLLREHRLNKSISRVIISSVVPQLTQTFIAVSRNYLHHSPLIVHTDLDLGIRNRTEQPGQVGADRLLNAVAAYDRTHQACIIVDLGTATKFDVVSSAGDFLGGVISPGFTITADALFQRAAKLSQVDLVPPPSVLGRNTVHALQSGLIFGYISMIEGLLPRLRAALNDADPEASPIHVIGTGGLLDLLAPHTDVFDTLEPWLTLDGLRIVADRNLTGR